jgi:hypothetical protein
MEGSKFQKNNSRSTPHGPCAMGKFSNFVNFAVDSKMFGNFPADSKKKFPPKLIHGAQFSLPVAHWMVRYW